MDAMTLKVVASGTGEQVSKIIMLVEGGNCW